MVDSTRSAKFFPAAEIAQQEVHIIGLGAGGSHQADLIANLDWPIEKIYGYDGDAVEGHNLTNQVYLKRHIGMNKADALKEFFEAQEMGSMNAIPEFITEEKDPDLGDIVIVATDSFASRKMIFEKWIQGNANINWFIDSRVGTQELRVYQFNPNNPEHCKMYLGTIGKDEESDPSTCGTEQSIKSMICVSSGIVVSQIQEALRNKHGLNEYPIEIPNSLIFNPSLGFAPERGIWE